MTGRILGLDPGVRRVGVALSDATGTISSPYTVIDRRSTDLTEALRRICRENDVVRIVVGLPVSLSGTEGESAVQARQLADLAASSTGLPVDLQDERFTTVTAEQALLESGVGRTERKAIRDKVAAAVMLQSYLDRKGNREPESADD